MNKQNANKLLKGFFGSAQAPAFGEDEFNTVRPLTEMIDHLLTLSDLSFGCYAWSREPLERKFDQLQKLDYVRKAIDCGQTEAKLLKAQYQTDDPVTIARQMDLRVDTPDTPTGGGHVIFAQYVEPDEVTIFMDAVDKGRQLIADHELAECLENVDVFHLLLAHEIFHAVECKKQDTIFTRTEKVELWKKPFSNRSGLICLGEIAGMAFAKELLNMTYSPYLFDVLLMYGYQPEAATALYEEIIEIAGQAAENQEE